METDEGADTEGQESGNKKEEDEETFLTAVRNI
jgi:hypothetical protein